MEPLNETTTRKLASVQIIKDIVEHTNSDNLALAKVLGWQVVVKRNEFKPGQKIVYFEIDSLLPDKTWCDFMKNCDFKVKTIKLRGEISQGLILPLSILGDNINESDNDEGKNLTDELGIVKYKIDAEESITIKRGGNVIKIKVETFPTHLIEKTDEPRIQSEPKILKLFEGKPYYAALKYDGTSGTYILNPNTNDFYICSRNNIREHTEGDCYTDAADKYQIKEKLLAQKNKYALQCEVYGPTINNNYLAVDNQKIAVFTIKDLTEGRFLDYDEFCAKCKELDLPMVEVMEEGDSFNYTIDELKVKSKGVYVNTKNPREGLVFRLKSDWYGTKRASFKIINDDYLVKKK
jgi:RNA ligase (TIGR02306 family)